MEDKKDSNDSQTKEDQSKVPQYKTSTEYFDALEKWMQSQVPGCSCNVPGSRNAFQFPQAGGAGGDTLRNRQTTTPNGGQMPQQAQNGTTPNFQEYQIPPIWKRFVAELLDFLILFFVKLAVTFIAVDIFNIIDLDKYDLDLLSRSGSLSYKKAVEMTAEIVILEGIHRIVVAIFEACWIRKGRGGQVGGATPGKLIMGIRVVLCERVTTSEGRPADTVLVYPATDLGWPWALARSFVKNLILAVLIPALFALFFLKHNRTGYDILCHTIVVEDRPRQRL